MDKPFIQIHDGDGNWAFFVEEMTLDYKGRKFAILFHTDENGQDLSDESILFEITEEAEPYVSYPPFETRTMYTPVEDDDLIDEIEAYLETLETH